MLQNLPQFRSQRVDVSHAACCCGSNRLCCRSDNLFQQLENRSLTDDEQKIIQNRVSKCLVPYVDKFISQEWIIGCIIVDRSISKGGCSLPMRGKRRRARSVE